MIHLQAVGTAGLWHTLASLKDSPGRLLLGLFVLSGVYWLSKRRSRRNAKGLPLPPGPEGLPIFGNLFQLTTEKPWVAYRDWGEIYGVSSQNLHSTKAQWLHPGDMVYFEVMGAPVLVLNSLRACRELFEKRAPNYSDRKIHPALAMCVPKVAFIAPLPDQHQD
jgi:hypothetical protein